MQHHLVILRGRYIEGILAGTKTIECRLSRTRQAPFASVQAGDRLWFKVVSGPILLTASVGRSRFIHPVTPRILRSIRRDYGRRIQAGSDFFGRHSQAQYASLIDIANVERIAPLEIVKRDRRGWVVLNGPPRAHQAIVSVPRMGHLSPSE